MRLQQISKHVLSICRRETTEICGKHVCCLTELLGRPCDSLFNWCIHKFILHSLPNILWFFAIWYWDSKETKVNLICTGHVTMYCHVNKFYYIYYPIFICQRPFQFQLEDYSYSGTFTSMFSVLSSMPLLFERQLKNEILNHNYVGHQLS